MLPVRHCRFSKQVGWPTCISPTITMHVDAQDFCFSIDRHEHRDLFLTCIKSCGHSKAKLMVVTLKVEID